jgi:hypothetical protein
MFKIEFRIQKLYDMPICCEIIDKDVTLWNIEVNKYRKVFKYRKENMTFSKVYAKYKKIFSHNMFPVNYSGKILSNDFRYKYITPLLNGKLHGNKYCFTSKYLLTVEKYYRWRKNTEFQFSYDDYIFIIRNLSRYKIFTFRKNGKLEKFSNTQKKIEFKLYRNGKINTYSNSKCEQFKFTEN